MIFTPLTIERAFEQVVGRNPKTLNKAEFKYYSEYYLSNILNDINNQAFEPSPLKMKKILFPKERIAQVPRIRDKIVQKTLCDEYLKKALSKPLIKETGACLDNRGTHYSSKILKNQLRNFYTKFGSTFYVLKCDIKSFFASIPHDRMHRLIDRYVDDNEVSYIVKRFVNQMNIGLALGLPQSHLLANLYLSELDHLCKEKLGVKYYGRYMDDFYILSNDPKKLYEYYIFINKYVNSIGLTLNPKTKIYKNSFNFLGFSYTMTNTGKIIKKLANDKKYSKLRHIRKMLMQIKNGQLDISKFANSYQGWRIHASNGNCHDLISLIDTYVQKELFNIGYKMIFKKSKKKERVVITCLEP